MSFDTQDKKRVIIGIMVVLILNSIIIFSSVKSGLNRDDLMYRFNERQTVTFLSALMLGLTAITSLYIYLLKRKLRPVNEKYGFWLLSAIGFFYLCMDEYFMAHEGLDEWVGTWFGQNIKSWNLDGLVIAFFGIIAAIICFYFRKAILKTKVILPFLGLGALCLVGTVFFHMVERTHLALEVTEESFKIVGVSFFFCGYVITLLSFLGQLSLIPGDLKKD